MLVQKPPPKSIFRIWKFGAEFQLRRVFQGNKKQFGRWVKDELTSLGPAFVKIGQFMSTRIDIFGKDVISELEKLQDDIIPVPYSFVQQELERELGDKYSAFKYVDPVPLAVASIGQVHRGVLKNGKQIVVKVQKPYIAQEIRDDLKILNDLNGVFLRLDNMQAKEMDMLLKQFEKFLLNEIDYLKEANNMTQFRKYMNELPLYIPEPYKDLTTKNVLTMEYVDAIKITSILNDREIDPIMVTQQLIDIFLNLIITYGICHGDLHAGNIGYVKESGNIVLFDFGNVVNFSKDFKKNVNNLVFAIFQKDVDELVDLLVRMNIIELENPLDTLELKTFFQSFLQYLEISDFDKLKNSILNSDYNLTIKVKINQDFLSLFRVFTLLDGTCNYLNPNLNYITLLQPYGNELFTDMGFINNRIGKDIQKLTTYPALLKTTDQNILRLNKRVTKITESMKLFMITAVVLNNLMEPEKIVLFLPLLIYMSLKM